MHHADPLTIGLPPYLAHLVTTENLEASGFDKTDDSPHRSSVYCVPTAAVPCCRFPTHRTKGWPSR
ncbi:MAG: hypothetical protein Ct9H300mP1_39010 [Planctomycetaceae bacterium]|nr:MAG: hypothetical protein Ct9H300mP1_39010 [Planctomycetaceae bacterium]